MSLTELSLGMPREANASVDVAGKYSSTYFRINGNGYDGSGRNPWPEHVEAAYTDEVVKILTAHGWDILEPIANHAAYTATKDRNTLYLHPQCFSGTCENAERERLFQSFRQAKTFACHNVDVYEEVFDMNDDELAVLLESKRDIIVAELIKALTTKRRNLYIVDVCVCQYKSTANINIKVQQ